MPIYNATLTFTIKADSIDDAQSIGLNAGEHLRDTFNDDDSLGPVTCRVAGPESVPNLDCMTQEDLEKFWRKHYEGRLYRDLFPAGGRGSKSVTVDLSNYASNKGTAMRLRLQGNIDSAKVYEAICERIYNQLPKACRW